MANKTHWNFTDLGDKTKPRMQQDNLLARRPIFTKNASSYNLQVIPIHYTCIHILSRFYSLQFSFETMSQTT